MIYILVKIIRAFFAVFWFGLLDKLASGKNVNN